MRIIAGTLKGRRFDPPRAFRGRPTTDYARESLFNVLNNRLNFENLKVLDLFTGTGAFSYECFSRGAEQITAVDHMPVSARYVPSMFVELGMSQARFVKADVFEFLRRNKEKVELVFADPPFEAAFVRDVPDTVFQSGCLVENGWLVLEHGPKMDFSATRFFQDQKQYGHVHFSFFRNSQA